MTRWKAGLGLWLATVAVSAAAAPWLPARVPVHWGLDGQPDRHGSKWELLLLGPVLLALTAGLQAWLDGKDRVKDPSESDPSRGQVLLLAMGMIAFFHGTILAHAGGLLSDGFRSMGVGFSLFWLLMGNIMGKVRPNATTGIRTPWTFRSPEVWRRTHRLAGKLMVLAGVLGLLGALLLPGIVSLWLVVGLVLVSALGPAVYSYVLWRRLST
jgi:uncharacterized membrane protein